MTGRLTRAQVNLFVQHLRKAELYRAQLFGEEPPRNLAVLVPSGEVLVAISGACGGVPIEKDGAGMALHYQGVKFTSRSMPAVEDGKEDFKWPNR